MYVTVTCISYANHICVALADVLVKDRFLDAWKCFISTPVETYVGKYTKQTSTTVWNVRARVFYAHCEMHI